MKDKQKVRNPSQQRTEQTLLYGNKFKVQEQVETSTKYNLYRGDLAKLAQRRYFIVMSLMLFLRKCAINKY